MGKFLVTTLLERHVNIYSDLYTLCFLHTYVQSPPFGAGPQGHHATPALCLPPFPLVPGIWSAKQISIRINKPLAPSVWRRVSPTETRVLPPHNTVETRHLPPEHGASGYTRVGKAHPASLVSAYATAGRTREHGVRGILVQVLAGNKVAISKYLPLCSSPMPVRGGRDGGRDGNSVG